MSPQPRHHVAVAAGATGDVGRAAGEGDERVDLLVTGAELVATVDDERRELAGGWVAVSRGFVSAVGSSLDRPPAATRVLRADGCLVTPGLVNTHHHMYQNLTRSFRPVVN